MIEDVGFGAAERLVGIEVPNPTAGVIYQPPSGVLDVEITRVHIMNTTGSSVQVGIFHDPDGTAAANPDLLYLFTVPANDTVIDPVYTRAGGIPIGRAGSISAEAAVGGCFIALYGISAKKGQSATGGGNG